MVNGLFANLVEAGVLGQIWYVAMHLAVHLDVLHYLLAVSLQSAVEVMQIMNAAHLAGRSVEQLGGYGLRERVALLTVLLVSRHEVVAFVRNHVVESRNLVGRVLQVSVHGDDHVALGSLNPQYRAGLLP